MNARASKFGMKRNGAVIKMKKVHDSRLTTQGGYIL